MVEVMTDKATVEIPSPRAGTIAKINCKDGEICPVGKVLVVIDDDGAGGAAPQGRDGHGDGASDGTATHAGRRRARASARWRRLGRRACATAPQSRRRARRAAARARDAGDAQARARARRRDRRACRRPARTAASRRTTCSAFQASRPAAAPRRRTPRVRADARSRRAATRSAIPLRGVRKKIAENDGAVEAHRGALHVRRGGRRDRAGRAARAREGARGRARREAHFLPFIVKAVVAGLKKYPMLNATLDEATQEIVRSKYYHIGIAAQGPHGPRRPVVRDADQRAIFELAREIDRLGEAVHAGKATRDELTGSTFTITLARQARRRARDADHQLPRGRDPRRAQDQGEARRCATGRSSIARRDEPVDLVRPPHRRRLGRRDVPPGREVAARGPDDDVHGDGLTAM